MQEFVRMSREVCMDVSRVCTNGEGSCCGGLVDSYGWSADFARRVLKVGTEGQGRGQEHRSYASLVTFAGLLIGFDKRY